MMLNTRNKKLAISSAIVLSILILGLFQSINYSYAQGNEHTVNLPQNFTIDEISEHNGTTVNADSIDINLPSSVWNVSDIELEFSDINFTRQLLTVTEEELGEKSATVNEALAVLINVSDTIMLYGVQISGWVYKPDPGDVVSIQIRGYNASKNAPNDNIILSQPINMSTTRQWWNQSFSSPIPLTKGNYSLVLNVTDVFFQQGKYYWNYNNYNPENPYLYASEYRSGSWSDGIQGEPFSCKLDQKVISDFYPETYDMHAEIGGIPRKIYNGTEPGTGNASISNIDYAPGSENFNIPISINRPYSFIFNCSYNITFKNSFSSDGTLTIKQNSNEWSIMPVINRTDGNYTVKFSYPNSWDSFSVSKNEILLTHGKDFINNTAEKAIYILNDTIPDENVLWEITAESKTIPIDFIDPDPVITAGEESISGVSDPLNGTYTYVLYAGIYEKYRNTTSYNGDGSVVLSFSYIIPPSGPNGDWTAVLYWNNETDAGVITSSFTVTGGTTIISGGGGGGGGGGGSTTVTGLDPLLVFTVSILIIVAIAGSLTSYQLVKRLKKKRDLQMQKLRNKVLDSLNLNYIMISENASGLNVFEQFFGGKEIDPSLISGFLSAIRSFGIELTGTFQQSQTIKLEFQNSKILMNEFRHFRLILLMGENPSDDFIESLDNLAQDVEKTYGDLIRDFDGSLTKFTGIGKLIERHLNVSFLFPLKIISSKATKLTPAEKLVFNKAKQIIKQNNLDYIFTSFLMDDQTYEPKKIKAIFGLIEKGIFQPIRLENQSLKR